MAGAVVFHHLVWVQHVTANLVAPAGGDRFAAHTRKLILARANLQFNQFAAQHALRRFAILHLRTLVLARDNRVSWKVGEAHCRLGLVHVLATCAA